MFEIVLDLNVTYSVLRLLIWFREAPWYLLVDYVQAITTAWRGLCATSIRFTISKVTGSYHCMSALSYHEIHLMRFICSYCTLIYNKYVILLCFIIIHHKTLLISQISNQFLCDIFQDNCLLHTSTSTTRRKLQIPTQRNNWNTGLYQERPIFVRDIMNLI